MSDDHAAHAIGAYGSRLAKLDSTPTIDRRSLVDNGWLAGTLQMGARNAVSRTIRGARELIKADRKAGQLARQLEKNVRIFDCPEWHSDLALETMEPAC